MKTALLRRRRGNFASILLTFLAPFIMSSLSAQIKIQDVRRVLGSFKQKNGNPNVSNKTPVKDTAAVLEFNSKPAAEFTTAHIQDISGTWEGEQSIGNRIMYYKICLNKIDASNYSGFDYSIQQKTIGNMTNTANTATPVATKSLIGRFSDAQLNFTEIQNIGNSNTALESNSFKFVDDNGTAAIISNNKNQFASKFYLKRTSQQFPQEYLKYIISNNNLQFDNAVFHNSKGKPTLHYNDLGEIPLTIKNNSELDLNNIKIVCTTAEQDNGIIDYDKLNDFFTLKKNSQLTLPLPIKTNFSVPEKDVHIFLTFSYGDVILTQKTLYLSTEAFFKTTHVTVPDYTSQRLKAVAGYYGLFNTPYSDVSKQLEPLVAAGDKMAAMWKSVFLTVGYGEYKIDEATACTIAKSSIWYVEDKARNGDAEALYLMFYACQVGLEGESATLLGDGFLERSASAGFLPALYDAALEHDIKKDYTTALSNFIRLYDQGIKKSARVIGFMYENGLGDNKNIATAIEWYKKGIAFGDPEASLAMAHLYSNGFEDTPPDINKAIIFATVASAKNCTGAMIFLGKIFFEGKQGIAKNIPSAIKWFKAGAEQGDRQAMLKLGEAYLSDLPGLVKDEHTGLFWIKKAAESGSAGAMIDLASIYKEGRLGEKDIVASRFWYNQAVINGFAKADMTGLTIGAQTFIDALQKSDFSSSYIYVNRYGEKVADGDDGLISGLAETTFRAMSSYYGNQQQLIDGLEYICKKNGYKVYGGTVSSHFVSNLYVKRGQIVSIKSYGVVSTGMMSGPATADGLGSAWAEYRFIKDIPCSAVMAGIKDGNWKFIGQQNTYTAPYDGPLLIAVNGIDFRNYKGYFDIVVHVPEN